ncbi:MAG: hypothetical protein QXL47_00140 [Candidatus Anstonellales archaeon]
MKMVGRTLKAVFIGITFLLPSHPVFANGGIDGMVDTTQMSQYQRIYSEIIKMKKDDSKVFSDVDIELLERITRDAEKSTGKLYSVIPIEGGCEVACLGKFSDFIPKITYEMLIQ